MLIEIDDLKRLHQAASEDTPFVPVGRKGPAPREEVDLCAYLDANAEQSLRRRLGEEESFTATEAMAMCFVADGVAELTQRRFEQERRPSTALLAAISPYRGILRIVEAGGVERPVIVELGSNCGYLGLLIAMHGLPYVSTESDLGRYLWQNRLFDWFLGDDFGEFARPEPSFEARDYQACHWPSWRISETKQTLAADIVLCNWKLSELAPDARRAVLKFARRVLKTSNIGLFLSPPIGASGENPIDSAFQSELTRLRLRRIPTRDFCAFCPLEVPWRPALLQTVLTLSAEVEGDEISLFKAEDFLLGDKKKADMTYDVNADEIFALSGGP